MPADPRAAVVARLRALPATADVDTVRVYRGEVRSAARGALNLSTILPAVLVVAAKARIGTSADALAVLDCDALVLAESRALVTEAAEADAYALARAVALDLAAAPAWTDGDDCYSLQTRDDGKTLVDVELLLSTDGLSVYTLSFTVAQSA